MERTDQSAEALRDALRDARVYSQADITKLLEIAPKTFQTHVSRGVFPNAPTTEGSGDRRRYSLNHATGFSALAELVNLGLPPRLIRNLSSSIDFAVQLGKDSPWLVIRRNPAPGSGALVTIGEVGWVGDREFEAIGVSDNELVAAIREAGDGAIVLQWRAIRNRVLARAAEIAAE